MENAASTIHRVRFKAFELDLHTRELFRNGVRLRVQGQPIDVLEMLLERPGELVTREQLRKKLWPEDTFVDFEHSLNSAVTRLRDALGDRAEDPKYIETLPRLGYRFVAAVEADNDQVPAHGVAPNTVRAGSPVLAEVVPIAGEISKAIAPPPNQAKVSEAKRRRHGLIIGGGALLLVSACVAFWYLHRPLPLPRITEFTPLTLDGRKKEVVGTDGNSLLLNIGTYGEPHSNGRVPMSGGKVVPFLPDLPSGALLPGEAPLLRAVSPDRSKLLVWGHFYPTEFQLDLWVVGILGRPAHLLTRALDATWSPDGKQVLYASSHGDFYLISSDGGAPRLLAASSAPSGDILPTSYLEWSPDGTRIRFTRDRTIWEMRADGTNVHQLMPGWRESHPACCGTWTAQGDFFLFLSGNSLLKGDEGNSLPRAQIWALDERRGLLGQRNSKPFPLAINPTLWGVLVPSRDGHRIFANGVDLRGELVRFDKQSKQLNPYLGGMSAEYLTFSHDGQYVAYVSFPEGILWRANRDGTGETQMTTPPIYPKNPRWSPDDKSIVFTDHSSELKDAIYVIPSEGGIPRRLLPDDKRPEGDATWSPDSRNVVFSTEGDSRAGPWKVDIVNLDTHEITTLPSREGGFWSPRWSPDGRYIAGLNSAFRAVILFDLQTKRWRTVFQGADAGWPCWSHDDRFIYFVGTLASGEVGIFRVPVMGGKAEQIMDLRDFRSTGFYDSWFGLDPDDNPLLLRDVGTDEIYALTMER